MPSWSASPGPRRCAASTAGTRSGSAAPPACCSSASPCTRCPSPSPAWPPAAVRVIHPMSVPLTVAFDADDTLWHSESIFEETHGRLIALLSPWVDAETLERTLLDTEARNLKTFGYGVKGFTLSMIETA